MIDLHRLLFVLKLLRHCHSHQAGYEPTVDVKSKKINNEKYANGSVGARVRLIVRGGCLPVKELKYADNICECGTKETEMKVFVESNHYDQMRRRWIKTMNRLDEKERKMDVVKGYV